MPHVANLDDISSGLANLLLLNVKRLAGSAMAGLIVSRLPPENAEEAKDTRLNVHLYHVSQDNDGGRDIPLGETGFNPVATKPMPLKLYFVLTAHAAITPTSDDVASQHKLMGWALKTLHDFGEVFEDTLIGTQKVFGDVTFDGRPIEIAIRPIEPEESVSFWSVDKERSARLSAFLELRTLLLSPEPPRSVGLPVLAVGLGVFPGGAPLLTGSQSMLSITRPAALGGGTVELPANPAVAVLHAAAGASDAVVTFTGVGLGDGTDAALALRGQGLSGAVWIRPADNPDWKIAITDDSLRFEVRPSVWVVDASGSGSRISLAPGFYTLALQRMRKTRDEEGNEYPVPVEGNRQAFAIAPTIASSSLKPGPNPRNVIVTCDAGSRLDQTGTELLLGIGSDAYSKVAAFSGTLATDAGKFIVTAPQSVEAVPLGQQTLTQGVYALRLTVNGVDSPPAWLVVP